MTWYVDCGEEGYFLTTGPDNEKFGMNHTYGPPERLAAKLNTLEAEAQRLRAALEKARLIADDLTQQAYESTTQGGVFFDTLSALRASLKASGGTEEETA